MFNVFHMEPCPLFLVVKADKADKAEIVPHPYSSSAYIRNARVPLIYMRVRT